MFKQVKSAMFWYYLYKFRRRVAIIFLLLIIAIFANAIYGDVVEYLKLKDKLQYFEIALISKWLVILSSLTISIYLFLTMFKNEEEKTSKNEINKEEVKIQEKTKEAKVKTEKFTEREKEFLYKKKIRNKADILVDK